MNIFENYLESHLFNDSITVSIAFRERDDLVSRLTANQAVKEEAEMREAEAYDQVQQSIQLVEQAQLERTEVSRQGCINRKRRENRDDI